MKAFSEHNPNLQLVWDASSLKSFQYCPRHYQYANLEGWRGSSVDLEFGRLIADAFEQFKKFRLDGLSTEAALLKVVRQTLVDTWENDDTQWGGRYETMWKCEGNLPYKNSRGHRAKCPNAHKGVWFPGDAPDVCGECHGGKIATIRRYVPDSPNKNRQTLLRTIIWYALSQPENLDDGYRPYVFPDGTKAVELSGRMPLPWFNPFGEQYMMAWNLDYIGQFGTELFITDNKTTKKHLNNEFFQSYNPDTQFDTYDVVATVAYPDLPIKGVMLEGVQVLVGSSEFGMRPFYKTEAYREEHFNDIRVWIEMAEGMALKGYWPMNKRNCFLCPFKGVCSQSPELREGYLKSNFTKGPRWDTLKQR